MIICGLHPKLDGLAGLPSALSRHWRHRLDAAVAARFTDICARRGNSIDLYAVSSSRTTFRKLAIAKYENFERILCQTTPLL